jgi:hypothetical protein
MRKITIVRTGIRRTNNEIAKIIVAMPRVESQRVAKSMVIFTHPLLAALLDNL